MLHHNTFLIITSIIHHKGVLGIVWLGARSQVRFPAKSRFLGPLGRLPIDKPQGFVGLVGVGPRYPRISKKKNRKETIPTFWKRTHNVTLEKSYPKETCEFIMKQEELNIFHLLFAQNAPLRCFSLNEMTY